MLEIKKISPQIKIQKYKKLQIKNKSQKDLIHLIFNKAIYKTDKKINH